MSSKKSVINKRIAVIDVMTFAVCIILLILVKLCYIFVGNNLPISIIFSILAIGCSVISLAMPYKNDINHLNFVNILICIFLFVLLYVVYLLPIFGFLGVKGPNNSICWLFEFTFGVKYITYFAYVLKSKSINDIYNINKKALNRKPDYYKIIIIIAMIAYAGAIIGTLINTFYPCIDMSMIYQMYILQIPFKEIVG